MPDRVVNDMVYFMPSVLLYIIKNIIAIRISAITYYYYAA